MEKLRKPFQGLFNIIRFNRHFYIPAATLVLLPLASIIFVDQPFRVYVSILCLLFACPILLSLLVSFYIYDLSGLYKLQWLRASAEGEKLKIVNIHAGFDETSILLKSKFPHSGFIVLDFYNPDQHTEISIRRARNAYPPFPGTRRISSTNLPLEDNSVDRVFLIFAAHEIRNMAERAAFLKELHRIILPNGQIIVAEHLRDAANFLAYTIGFFHFYSRSSWKKAFRQSGLIIHQEIKFTPFISIFILQKNGNSL